MRGKAVCASGLRCKAIESMLAQVSYFKKRLMFCMAGLDRGFAANATAVKDTEAAIYSLVGAAGGAPTLSYQAPEGAGLAAVMLADGAQSVRMCLGLRDRSYMCLTVADTVPHLLLAAYTSSCCL